jgi:signal transduction histidine kinase
MEEIVPALGARTSSAPGPLASPRLRRFLAQGLSYIVIYVALDWVSFFHEYSPLGFTPWNPPPGLTLAFLISTTPLNAVWLLPAPFLADLLVRGLPAPMLASLLSAAAISAGYATAAILVRRLNLLDPALRQVRDVLFLLASGLVASFVVAQINTTIFVMYGLFSVAEMPVAASRHWLGDFIGITVLTPFLLILPRFREILNPRVLAEIATVALSSALMLWILFGLPELDEFKYFYLLFLPVLWSAMRHGLLGVTPTIVATQLGLIVAIVIVGYETTTLVEFQLLMIALSFTGLLVGSVVSERKEARDALRDREQTLRQRQDQLAQFARASALGELASSLVHEISQPLSAATTYIDACHRLLKKPALDMPRALSNIAKAQTQAERAGKVLAGLRQFLYRGETRLEPIQVGTLIESVRRLSEPETARLGIELRLGGAAGAARILADRIQLEQVLLNLLRNAFDALSESRIYAPLVEVSTGPADGAVEITVTDNGPGVSPELAQRIFEPFVTSKGSGMGLGLTISRSIVEAHGGRLGYAPHAGGGSVFRVTLPVAEGT